LVNVGNNPVDMTGWQLGDDEQLSFTFPSGYIFQPGQIVVIFGGGDISTVPGYDPDPLTTRIFTSDTTDFLGNGLANGGDFFLLFSPDGSYDLYAGYNSAYNSGPPITGVVSGIDFEIRIQTAAVADNNNSVTRNPDGNISISDPFVEHLTVSSDPFSPGLTIDGYGSLTAIEDNSIANLPSSYKLHQNYPNPFNPTTTITFDLPKSSYVSIKVYNIQGQVITTLVNKDYPAGQYEIEWDGKNHAGHPVSSGLYLYKIEADDFKSVNKMMLMK